jgi:hypothetical protein
MITKNDSCGGADCRYVLDLLMFRNVRFSLELFESQVIAKGDLQTRTDTHSSGRWYIQFRPK